MPSFDPKRSNLTKWIDLLILSFLLLFINLVLFVALQCALAPADLIFLGQLIPQKYFSYFPHAILLTIFHTYLFLIIAITMAINCILIYTNLFYLTIVLSRELNLNLTDAQAQYRTSSNLRSYQNLKHAYRSFQVLIEYWNCVLSLIIWSGLVTCVALPSLYNVILFHYWGELRLLAKVTLVLGTMSLFIARLAFLQFGKYLWVEGNKTLDSWKMCSSTKRGWGRRKENEEMKKFIKSCRLVLLRYGRVFVIGRMDQIAYIMAVIKWTLKMTLALEK